jgi:hypothetical protein
VPEETEKGGSEFRHHVRDKSSISTIWDSEKFRLGSTVAECDAPGTRLPTHSEKGNHHQIIVICNKDIDFLTMPERFAFFPCAETEDGFE